jgi:single-strand selective monofunctional uracil DNA glycosylase
MSLVRISRSLSKKVSALEFSAPVAVVYNPLAYAREPHEKYLERFGAGKKEVVLVGMNPGPFGMAQSGVPFGDVALVRDWMGIVGRVSQPKTQHPKRPVLGFDCARSEVSGSRLWGWAKRRFETPEQFFERFFVVNYCPLCFMEEGGKNVTPNRLARAQRQQLFSVCDAALKHTVLELGPRLCVGIGGFALERLQVALAGSDMALGTILHPSPASPKANRGWANVAEQQLADLGVKF